MIVLLNILRIFGSLCFVMAATDYNTKGNTISAMCCLGLASIGLNAMFYKKG